MLWLHTPIVISRRCFSNVRLSELNRLLTVADRTVLPPANGDSITTLLQEDARQGVGSRSSQRRMASLMQEGHRSAGLSAALGDLERRLAAAGSDTESLATGRSHQAVAGSDDGLACCSGSVAVDVRCATHETGLSGIAIAASSPSAAPSSPAAASSVVGGGITLAFDKLCAELVISRPCFGQARLSPVPLLAPSLLLLVVLNLLIIRW